jgi:hypothetical protein
VGVKLIADILADACLEGKAVLSRNKQMESEGRRVKKQGSRQTIEY